MFFNPLPILITLAGIYLLFKLRFFFIFHPFRSFGRAVRTLAEPEKLKSFTLALAGTLGVGNVFGVCVGIIVGGPGSVFWLFVSAVFSSVLKYAEVVLTADNKSDTSGGMFYIVRNTYSRCGGRLSRVYAVACLALSLVMGAALQSNTVSKTGAEIFNTPPYLLLTFFVTLTALAAFGGGKIISKITLIIIPLVTIVYIFLTSSVIFTHIDGLGKAIASVIDGAMAPEAGIGGVFGFLLGAPMREGYSRGILSNEAGAGTSTIAHATSGGGDPATRGLLGILEVFFDTALLCMLTAFCVLLSVPDPAAFDGGMSLILASFDLTFGGVAKWLLLICVFAFAFSTVVCWYYYGTECIRQLFGREYKLIYFPAFLLATVIGGFSDEGVLVLLADILLLMLTVITLPTLIKNSDRVVTLSEKSGLLKIKGNVSSSKERHRWTRSSP